MSKNIVKVWMERVTAEVWEPGVIRQYCTAVMPRSMGYEFGGHRMKMTASEAQDIVEAFDARVERDGGPLVTPEQANIGIRWLNGQWRRFGMPYLNYSTIDFFRFRDALVFDETAFRAVVGPQYDAYFLDGRVLRYAPTSWMSGDSKLCEWSWVQERSRI